jgi:hypothetical protein|tara:strand:- start:249 stop:368 length:120 start_codon:yes stop_codon:yes gene_type:complete
MSCQRFGSQPDYFDRTTLTITDKGRELLAQNMHLVEFDG